jgi:hypothetical protein
MRWQSKHQKSCRRTKRTLPGQCLVSMWSPACAELAGWATAEGRAEEVRLTLLHQEADTSW